MIPKASMVGLVAVYMLIFSHGILSIHQKGLFRLMIAVEDMQDDMVQLKSGASDWIEGLPQFIQDVRNAKIRAKEVKSGNIPGSHDFYALASEIRSKIPDPYATTLPPKLLYHCSSLQHLDKKRRNYAFKASANHLDAHQKISGCSDIKVYADIYGLDETDITVSHVCSDLEKCSTVARPFGFRSDDDVTQACAADNKCDVNIALPLMTAMFYSKMYEMTAHHICCELNNDDEECQAYEKSHVVAMHEADLLLAYAYSQQTFWSFHWNTFFANAISSNAHVDIDAALLMMEENKQHFETTRLSCRSLKFSDACIYDDIYKQYEMIETNRQIRNNPRPVKDLRLHQQMDHAKMIELQNLKINQIELLGSINKLDGNLQASVSGISTFLADLAEFDKGIADADAVFIETELSKYTTALLDVERQLTADLQEAMTFMAAAKTAALAEDIAMLAISIATNSNPLKLIFSGPDLTDIADQMNQIADSGANLGWALALIASLSDLVWDSFELTLAFLGNNEQLSTLESVKDQIINGQANELNEDADKFLEQYSAYTPQTDRARLAHNNALWSAFKDSTCDMLTDEGGIAVSVVKGIATGKLLCERLEGTLAQFFTLREDVFDFQFQLVDAIAGVVRGNIAYRLAQNIKGKGDAVNGAELLISSFMTQSNLQTVASMQCDTIEYRQLGRQFTSGCATFRGLFSKENLDALVAYTRSTETMHQVTRYASIPTQPSYPGDTAYVDLNSLARGNEVVFKIPKNITWLRDHKWTIPGQDTTQAAFVYSFEIYLPHKSYKSGSIPSESTMEVTIKSIAGSSISSLNPNTGSVYLLPRGSGTYLTTYEENYSNCPKEIKNPYSLCNNLPDLCVLSSRHPGKDALLPTTISTWSIRLRRSQGSRTLTWDAPHPATKLSLVTKIVLQAPSDQRKHSHISKRVSRSDIVDAVNGCCEGNRYKIPLSDDKCETCPTNSTSLLRGLYCDLNLPSRKTFKLT